MRSQAPPKECTSGPTTVAARPIHGKGYWGMGDDLTVLHVFPIDWGRMSGLTAAIPPLVEAQNAIQGVDAGLFAPVTAVARHSGSQFAVFDLSSGWQPHAGTTGLPAPFSTPDIAVLHSTYILGNIWAARQLHGAGFPYILVPHGGITRTAQRIGRVKKTIGNLFFFRAAMRNALAVQYLTAAEAAESSDWGCPHFVVGNGTRIPSEDSIAPSGVRPGLRFVYLGRLATHIKGLDLLLEACAIAAPDLRDADAQVLLYGPGFRGSVTALREQIGALNLQSIVQLPGPVAGEEKEKALREGDVFVLTSRSEAHPMAALEALSYGLPCLLTPGTRIHGEVVAAGAGWEVAPTPQGIAQGILAAIAGRSRLTSMGAKARQLAINKYSWESAAWRTVAAYRECLQGMAPANSARLG